MPRCVRGREAAVQLSFDKALAAQEAIVAALEVRYPRFTDRARQLAVAICHERGCVTSDDLREAMPIPAGVHHNAMGSVFRGGLFVRIGWRNSAQPRRHGNRVGIWQLKEVSGG